MYISLYVVALCNKIYYLRALLEPTASRYPLSVFCCYQKQHSILYTAWTHSLVYLFAVIPGIICGRLLVVDGGQQATATQISQATDGL